MSIHKIKQLKKNQNNINKKKNNLISTIFITLYRILNQYKD